MSLCHGRRPAVQRLGLFLAPFLDCPGLPFAEVLSEEQIEAAFAAQGGLFGQGDDDVYTPGVTLWAFLSQVMQCGQLSSCTAAVDRVNLLRMASGLEPCSADSGAYCRARAKFREPVLETLVYTVADELEDAVPDRWLWHQRHVKLIDGTTVTMEDTEANQKAYPQPSTQKPGLGFPIARIVAILSLATGAVCGMAVGPCQGKETGEPALLRQLWHRLNKGDVAVADCCYGSYVMVALGLQRGIDWVVTLHQRRRADFRRGERLGNGDHIVYWQKPEKAPWMDDATHASLPDEIPMREVRLVVDRPGHRAEQLVVATTLLDHREYPKAEIADIFRARWHAELDLRAIKDSLKMDRLRCKSPHMVEREIWAHWLGYNLTRKVMAQAASAEDVRPRQISFAQTRASITNWWDRMSTSSPQTVASFARSRLRSIASCRVGNRPGRVEPRAVKRRPKPHPLLNKPRAQARAEMLR